MSSSPEQMCTPAHISIQWGKHHLEVIQTTVTIHILSQVVGFFLQWVFLGRSSWWHGCEWNQHNMFSLEDLLISHGYKLFKIFPDSYKNRYDGSWLSAWIHRKHICSEDTEWFWSQNWEPTQPALKAAVGAKGGKWALVIPYQWPFPCMLRWQIMDSRCARGDSGGILERISYQKKWWDIGMGCPGRWWGHRL